MDSRRVVRYPDSHQLFVGNLPHDIDENELKDFFMSKFFLFFVFFDFFKVVVTIALIHVLISVNQSSSHLLLVSPVKHLEMLLSCESTLKALEERFPTLALLSLMILSRYKEF